MLWEDIQKIRTGAPLVHNITNYVVMNSTANALLAAGASPVMAHAVPEVSEMAGLAQALVLNIGTLSPEWVKAMLLAGKTAKKRGIPVILDPVGSGATKYRTQTALQIIRETRPAVIRGNASEIRSLAQAGSGTKGVDSVHTPEEIIREARALSETFDCVVSVSGPVDMVFDSGLAIRIANGHPMMTRVTGMGCAASALTGAFAAVNPSPFQAAAHAMALMGLAGEMAAEKSAGPGSFALNFLDALTLIGEADIRSRLKMTGPDAL